ncbi:MAG: IscS subfamily cysteine desulfurase [Planctomycetes bacterium]|jgi:cysteine desulfurase|nr:IscS subfamily cysteine desulfurase [Planctomycetota bacterium]MDP6425255.1 aminotransferase class V-fold PLP-dependent enzyme [Planctomycetota bacterium]
MPSGQLIYLDYAATTPLDPAVLETMRPYLEGAFGNAASRHHRLGLEAASAVEVAREQVATLLGADPREIYWTSGATESNNLALKGVAAAPAYGQRRHIVTVRTEHKAVLDPCASLEAVGYEVTYLGVDGEGRLDVDALADALRDDTLLVSVMHANNELGVLHPVEGIGALCRERGVVFHTDAAQTFGKEAIDVEACSIDLLSFSAHKIYGPKGAGGLYVRRRGPRVRCEPLLHGGGHEKGLRSGTLNVPGVVGLGAAAALASSTMSDEQERIRGLRDHFERELLARVDGLLVNGGARPRVAGLLNVSFVGIDAEALLESMPDLAASTAAACSSATRQPSYVLGAMGMPDARVRGSVRFSLGRFTTRDEIDRAMVMIEALGS